jgi:hypothetical protein
MRVKELAAIAGFFQMKLDRMVPTLGRFFFVLERLGRRYYMVVYNFSCNLGIS